MTRSALIKMRSFVSIDEIVNYIINFVKERTGVQLTKYNAPTKYYPNNELKILFYPSKSEPNNIFYLIEQIENKYNIKDNTVRRLFFNKSIMLSSMLLLKQPSIQLLAEDISAYTQRNNTNQSIQTRV
jgi:hypothetical protein